MTLMVKNLPIQEILETQVQSLSQEDLLEEGMATHSRIFAWRIPWTRDHYLHFVAEESGLREESDCPFTLAVTLGTCLGPAQPSCTLPLL